MTPPRTLMSYLQTPIAPWSSLLVVPAGTTASALVKAPAGFVLRVINGKKCATSAGLFTEFARALGFPDYFGHNWDAMEECLADLEWLPAKGYVLLLTDAQAVLADDEDEYDYGNTSSLLVNVTVKAWRRPPRTGCSRTDARGSGRRRGGRRERSPVAWAA